MLIKLIKSQHGFGFFGMMVLVIVLAVMGSIVMVTIDTTTSNQAINETITKMERIQKAAIKFKTDSSAIPASRVYPPSLAHLVSDVSGTPCVATPGSSQMVGWCGPYLELLISNNSTDYATDGWGTTFEYNGTTTLFSWGPNKIDNNGASDDITRVFP